jgi:hypothetical protein
VPEFVHEDIQEHEPARLRFGPAKLDIFRAHELPPNSTPGPSVSGSPSLGETSTSNISRRSGDDRAHRSGNTALSIVAAYEFGDSPGGIRTRFAQLSAPLPRFRQRSPRCRSRRDPPIRPVMSRWALLAAKQRRGRRPIARAVDEPIAAAFLCRRFGRGLSLSRDLGRRGLARRLLEVSLLLGR